MLPQNAPYGRPVTAGCLQRKPCSAVPAGCRRQRPRRRAPPRDALALTPLLHGVDSLLVTGRAGLQRQDVPVQHRFLALGVKAVRFLALECG